MTFIGIIFGIILGMAGGIGLGLFGFLIFTDGDDLTEGDR